MSESDFELVEGSGNLFRDLGDPDADLKQAKAILATRIIAVLDERGLSVRKADDHLTATRRRISRESEMRTWGGSHWTG